MSPSRVVVTAPATTANMGPGFDVFGLALEQPRDKVTLLPISKGIELEIAGLWSAKKTLAPEESPLEIVARQILNEFSLKTGVSIRIERGILPGIGLGSSAASVAAVAYGMNRLFDLKLDERHLIQFAAKGEVATAGFEHADNVSAAICGNFVVIKSYNPLEIVKLAAPEDMQICVAYPHFETPANKTEKARLVVPKQISIDKLVYNVGRAATMAIGFATGDVDLIGNSMSDAVVEPARIFLIPGYEKVKSNALKAGACGVAISGAGPAMIGIVNRRKADATKIARAMKEGFESVGLEATAYNTKPGKGVQLMEMN